MLLITNSKHKHGKYSFWWIMNYKNFPASKKLLYGLRTEFSQKKCINYGLFYESRILNSYPNIYYGDTLHTATNFVLYNSIALMISKCLLYWVKVFWANHRNPTVGPLFHHKLEYFYKKICTNFCFPSIFFSIANNF